MGNISPMNPWRISSESIKRSTSHHIGVEDDTLLQNDETKWIEQVIITKFFEMVYHLVKDYIYNAQKKIYSVWKNY